MSFSTGAIPDGFEPVHPASWEGITGMCERSEAIAETSDGG
jgi:hypothetical protein